MARLERFARQPTDLAASIDGATRETFESIRRGSRFDRVIETLRLYKKMRDVYFEVGSKLWINFVALRRNIEELPALVDLAAELGAELIVVVDFTTGIVPPEIAAEHLSHYPDLANRIFDKAAERARRHGIALQTPPKYPLGVVPGTASRFKGLRRSGRLLPERHRFPQRCSDPWMAAYITAGGLVHTCCFSRRAMGDLTRQSFAEIWNDARYRRFRRRINSFLPPIECRRCTLFWGINASNPAVVQTREGMLVKLLYAAEESGRRLVRGLLNRWRRKAA
jgi:MoaA/NifB/PqqE/SkfB family radical SAM enzyme